MLKHLRKLFTAQAGQSAPAETQEEDVNMTQETGAAPQAAADANAVDMASLSASVVALTSQLAEANEKITSLMATIAAADEEKALTAAQAEEAKMSARKAQLVEAVGTTQADALMTVMGDLTDTAFATVLTGMTAAGKKEADSPAFTEAGVDAKADVQAVSKAAESNPVMDYLTAKYGNK